MPAELRKLLKLWSAARDSGEECALATVVRVEGSSYRKPGARMLISRSGNRAGTVSGGCLEAEVARKIWWLTESGPSLQRYTTSFDEDAAPAYGLGCHGTVTLLLERASRAEDVLQSIEAAIDRRVSSAIVTVIGTEGANAPSGVTEDAPLGARLVLSSVGDRHTHGLSADLQQWLLPMAMQALDEKELHHASIVSHNRKLELFAEYLAPPPALFVFGAGDDAQPLVELAHTMGWQIIVADGRSNLAMIARFPAAAQVKVLNLGDPLHGLSIRPGDSAVVLTHSYQQDAAILRALLPVELGYLGVLGPRRRTARLVEEAAPSIGIDPQRALESVKSPVGLDLGVGSPQVIALSIVAEVQAVLSRRSALPLHLAAPPLAVAVNG